MGEIRRLTKFATQYETEFAQIVMGHSIKAAEQEQRMKQKELNSLIARGKELDTLFKKIYEDNVSGKISDERFSKLSVKYDTEQKELNIRVKELEDELAKKQNKSVSTDMFITSVRKYTRARKLTTKILNELIEKIEDVYKRQTFDSAKAMITADGAATEQTITVTASTADVNGSLKVVVTKNPFTYKPVDGGFEIDNGNKNYTRPIYAAHTNDNGETSFRYIYYLGDRPKLVLSNAGTGTSFFRFAHMFLGIKDGKWLDEMSNITARYVNGHEEYVIKDSSFEGEIKLTYTRSDKIDAMLVKAELPDSVKDKLVVAAAGGNRIDSKQPTGGNSSALEFSPSDTNSTVPTFTDNSFSITGSYATISGTSNVKMNYAAKDSSMYSSGVDALLTSTAANQPMVVGTTDGNTENTVYMMITTCLLYTSSVLN